MVIMAYYTVNSLHQTDGDMYIPDTGVERSIYELFVDSNFTVLLRW